MSNEEIQLVIVALCDYERKILKQGNLESIVNLIDELKEKLNKNEFYC